jgi:hypothetical protein
MLMHKAHNQLEKLDLEISLNRAEILAEDAKHL